MHTCDKRATRTEIRTAFPDFSIEKGFTEEDELWMPDVRETDVERDLRIRMVLDRIFRNYNDTCE